MSLTLAVNASYATIDEADVYLENNAAWNAASDETREEALLWARYYIDYRFNCIDVLDSIPDELIFATAILAAEYVVRPNAFKPQATVIKKAVQVGSIKTFKQFSSDDKVTPSVSRMAKTMLRRIAGEISNNRFVR
jgi:hypothetical protein